MADIAKITLQIACLMKNEPRTKGFKLRNLLKCFDIKSNSDKEKPHYHFVLKQYLLAKGLGWQDLEPQLLTSGQCQ